MAVVHVIRISSGGIASATFRIFDRGIAAWAYAQGLDRTDEASLVFSTAPTADDIRDGLSQTLTRLSDQFSKENGDLIVGVPGPTLGRQVIFSPGLPFLGGDFLPQIITSLWQGQFFLANNTNLLAMAELHQGALSAISSAILVTLGSGIGSSLIIAKEVFLGDKGLGGEIGHIVVDNSPQAPQCACGQRGCLERYISGDALRWFANERDWGVGVTELSQLATMPQAQEMIEQARRFLALHLVQIIAPLDIQTVVFGGQLVDLYDLGRMTRLLNEMVPPFIRPITVLQTRFSPREGALIGGAVLGFRLQGENPARLTTRE